MSRPRGPYARFVAWTEHKAPALHRFLTTEDTITSWARTIIGFGLVIGLGVLILWGLTGQSLSEPPVVVIESGSMMDCAEGPNTVAIACGSTSFGRLGTIDPGDLVFVADVDERADVETLAQGGRERHGQSGDVIVYSRPGGPPIIHRAMFWVDIHDDATYSIPELGISRAKSTDRPELNDADRWGLVDRHGQDCQLKLPLQLGPDASGFVTKGDNNGCWDQGSTLPTGGGAAFQPTPIGPDIIIGKARGELPWIGLLKLWVFDILNGQLGSGDYAAAPADLRRAMWFSVVLLVGVPYGIEYAFKKRHGDEPGEQATRSSSEDDAPPGKP